MIGWRDSQPISHRLFGVPGSFCDLAVAGLQHINHTCLAKRASWRDLAPTIDSWAWIGLKLWLASTSVGQGWSLTVCYCSGSPCRHLLDSFSFNLCASFLTVGCSSWMIWKINCRLPSQLAMSGRVSILNIQVFRYLSLDRWISGCVLASTFWWSSLVMYNHNKEYLVYLALPATSFLLTESSTTFLPGNSWNSVRNNTGQTTNSGQFGYGHSISRASLPFQGEYVYSVPPGLRIGEEPQDICGVSEFRSEIVVDFCCRKLKCIIRSNWDM